MSNDQSPPARKVIPYKKGGRRESPFSKMAFQFSGTALDVAIQQRQHGAEEQPSEPPVPPSLPPSAESAASVEDSKTHELAPEAATTSQPGSVRAGFTTTKDTGFKTELAPPPQQHLPVDKSSGEQRETRPLRAVRRLPTKEPAKTAHPAEASVDLQTFTERWKPFLTDTQIAICVYIYNNSVGIEREYCFTSTTKLMTAASKTERQIKTVLNQLIDWQFVLKGETIANAPREKRGTYYKLNLGKV